MSSWPLSSPSQPRVDLVSRAVRENWKVLDVGAGATEGERMSEKLERKEERGREWAQVGGRVPPPLPAPLQGPWTETIKRQAQTSMTLPS